MQDQLIDLLLTGTIDTLLMVGVSAIVAFLIGLPLAVILVKRPLRYSNIIFLSS